MKKRIIKCVNYISIVLIIGIIYAGICSFTGSGIPCIFRTVTGYKCPGCGITHMMICLLRLDFKGAFLANRVIFILMPLFAVLIGYHMVQYIKYGKTNISKKENYMFYVLIAILVIWGICRNFL